MKWNIFLAKILYIYRQREGHSQRARNGKSIVIIKIKVEKLMRKY